MVSYWIESDSGRFAQLTEHEGHDDQASWCGVGGREQIVTFTRLALNGIDRWIGGVRLTPDNVWRWDPVSRVWILRRDTAERLDLLSRVVGGGG